jgi:hypothetical protein
MSSERIVTNLIDSRQVTSMMSSMSKPGGRLVRGIPSFMPDETFTQLEFDRDRADASQEWMGSFFGEYGDRYLMVAPGSENLKAEDVTAIGGVCAIRSSDMALLQNGAIADPESGEVTAYSSAEQVAEWIERSVSIDQAIESIGLFKGQNYAVISEEKLWMKRIVSAVGANINLSQIDVDRLAESLQRAETMRLNMIQKYISYAKGQQMDIRFFSDKDLYEDLVRVRDEMLRIAGIKSIDELVNASRFVNEKASIPGYSIVWGMYTGPYMDVLKSRGVIQTSKGMILEPWIHATSETPSKAHVTDKYFRRGGGYLEDGPNQDLGFSAFYDVMHPNGKRMRTTQNVGFMPNISNYRNFIQMLSQSPSGMNLTLSENDIFMWGANLFPYGNTRLALIDMIAIKDEYKRKRVEMQSASGDRKLLAAELKREYQMRMFTSAQVIIIELDQMLTKVCSG